MPKFISLTPSVPSNPQPAPKLTPSVPAVTLKPAVTTPAVTTEETSVAVAEKPEGKMRILIIDSEDCMAYIFRSCLAVTYDVRIDQEISGDYDLLICHQNDLAGHDVDMAKVKLASIDFSSPIRSRDVTAIVRVYQTTKGY